MSIELSIVIATYNPQERIFARVLKAVESLRYDDRGKVECVIVDNRSTPPVQNMPCVQEFLRAWPNARIVREETPGLMHARLAGIRATTGQAIVSFDDDNVPDPAYLQGVSKCMRDYPCVGVWGPGKIDVELLDPVPGWLKERAKASHSQRSSRFVQYGFTPTAWHEFYPIGMGQAVRREVAESYRRAVEAGTLAATGRKGLSLTSGEDVQIVWHAMTLGFAAGTAPALAITHLIPGSRTTLRYFMRLAFGVGSSYHPARAQVYPGEYERRQPYVPRTSGILMQLWRVVWKSVLQRNRFLPVDFAGKIGDICGRMTVEGYGNEHWIFKLAMRLGLKE